MNKTCHSPTLVKIGNGEILLGGREQFTWEQLEGRKLIPLNSQLPYCIPNGWMDLYWLPMTDMGGVPANWDKYVTELAILVDNGQRFAAYCHAGHGRTGTLAASLIAILEPHIVDPIEEIRNRYCSKAVETIAQSKAIYKLKGQELPFERYLSWFKYIIRQNIYELDQPVTRELFDGWDIPPHMVDKAMTDFIPGYLEWWRGVLRKNEEKDKLARGE